MILYVMRHGPAEDRPASGLDADRKLTIDGRELVMLAATELVKKASSHALRIFASPLIRARETAELMASVVAPDGSVAVREDLGPDEEPPLPFLRELLKEGQDALLIGHQPGVEHLVRMLVDSAGRGVMPFGFRTAMVVGLTAGSAPTDPLADPVGLGRWRLKLVLDPRSSQPL